MLIKGDLTNQIIKPNMDFPYSFLLVCVTENIPICGKVWEGMEPDRQWNRLSNGKQKEQTDRRHYINLLSPLI